MVYDNVLLAFLIGPMEIGMIAVVGLLIFGNRLPEVGKSLGKGIVEFKKGVRGITDEIEHEVDHPEVDHPEPKKLDSASDS